VIIAGPAGGMGFVRSLYVGWERRPSPGRANGKPYRIKSEALVEVPATLTDSSVLQLVSDTGDTVYYNDGIVAKELAQPTLKKFRRRPDHAWRIRQLADTDGIAQKQKKAECQARHSDSVRKSQYRRGDP
jgi:hypothetical protein